MFTQNPEICPAPEAPIKSGKDEAMAMEKAAIPEAPLNLSYQYLGQALFLSGIFIVLGDKHQFSLKSDAGMRQELRAMRFILASIAKNDDKDSPIMQIAAHGLKLYDGMKMPKHEDFIGGYVESSAAEVPLFFSDIRAHLVNAVQHAFKFLSYDDAMLYCAILKDFAAAVAQAHNEENDVAYMHMNIFNFIPVALARIKRLFSPKVNAAAPRQASDYLYDANDPNDALKITSAEVVLMDMFNQVIDQAVADFKQKQTEQLPAA